MPEQNLTEEERRRRRRLLAEINRRVALEGPHAARPHPSRARQFMPFAALKGYDEMIERRTRKDG